MELMKITVISVVEKDGQCRARAIAEADKAKIWVEFQYDRTPDQNIWVAARTEVLRYLDIA